MVVPPTGNLGNLREVMNELFQTTTPIVLYGIAGDVVSDEVGDNRIILYYFLITVLAYV